MGNLKIFFSFTIKFILLVLLKSSTPLFVDASASYDGNMTDYHALLAFKSLIVSDPQSTLSSWNHSINFCKWEGVICGRKHRRVIILNLHSKGLVGTVSPFIGNMSFLRLIRLENNTLQGNIPNEIGRLFRLQALVLNNNSFGGEIPSNLSFCSNLWSITLNHNKLVGKIPIGIQNLFMLEEIVIHFNYLTGVLPAFLGNISSLKVISISFNAFEGAIPASIGQLKFISYISMEENNLSDVIPSSLYNISAIEILSLANNKLFGSLPSNIGFLLPRLLALNLNLNQLSGAIPKSLSNLSDIDFIDLSDNDFAGNIDVHFGSLHELRILQFYRNSLVSDELSFISSLTNCSKLERLSVSENLLNGMLPDSFVNLSSTVIVLDFSGNQIYGSLPSGLPNLVSLSTFTMEDNRITGIIPKDIGMMQNLVYLNLQNNILSGKIPSSIGNLSSLSSLYLGNNILQGIITSALGNCRRLMELNLYKNNFTFIPNQLFSTQSMLLFLDLSNNQLIGGLPADIGNLFNLYELYLSHNQLSGQLPTSLSGLSSLEILYINNNRIQGNIPAALESIKGLRKLDLSQNNLSGEIPEYLEKLALEYLNFSFNNFEGVVPVNGVFENASAVSVEGNSRLCGGIQELQLPRCINEELRTNRSHVIKIVVILISCAFGVMFLSAFLYLIFKRKNSRQYTDSMQISPIQKVSYQQIFLATDGFSSANLIGVGSYGSVYKGNLDKDGPPVAIKVLNLHRPGASKSFTKECEALGKTHHRNLLKILTCCSSIDNQGNDFKAIVYEYMPNESLGSWLHPDSEENTKYLSFQKRLNIAIDIGNALDHLHHHCEEPIIHCDLKPTNILLDDDMVAHVGDFGLAKFLYPDTNEVQSSSVAVRGTIGYTAPEYGLGSALSKEGDVYSYGVLLLEMMTGKKPTDDIFAEGHNIHKLARMTSHEQVLDIIDPILVHDDECKSEWLISMIEIGVQCSMDAPHERMSISDAIKTLILIRNNLMGVKNSSK